MIEKYMCPRMSELGCTQGNPTVNSEYMRSWMTELGCTQENLNKKAEKNK